MVRRKMEVIVDKDAAVAEPELQLLERSRAITVHGRDRMGRAVVRVVGNNFPGSPRISDSTQIIF
jgi:hypothetical protein